jgi:hypothetical protein
MTFNPKFLHELVYDLYENEHEEVIKFKIKEILREDASLKGDFWEKVCAKHMPHTIAKPRNARYMDYTDGTDAKFATLIQYKNTGQFQATIGNISTKIGGLRICLCKPSSDNNPLHHKLYFLFVPYSWYSKRRDKKGKIHPLKITFKNFTPYGEAWNNFNCSFESVTRKV